MKCSSIALSAVALASVGYVVLGRIEPAKSNPIESAESARSVVEVKAADSSREVAALRVAVAALSTEVARLREQMNLLAAEGKTERGAEGVLPPLREANSREEQESERHALMAKLDANFDSQPRDAKWASATTASIKDVVNAVEDLRSAGAQVDCRSQTCRVTLDEDSPGKLTKSVRFMMQQLSETLPRMSVEYAGQGNGHTSVIVYMDRTADDPATNAKN